MANRGKQLHVTVDDRVGKLAELTDKLSAAGVNLLAVCAWIEGRQGHMLLVADDPEKATQALRPVVGSLEAQEAICFELPNEVGALGKAAHKLADASIAIRMVYATAAGNKVHVVMQTSDDVKAATIL